MYLKKTDGNCSFPLGHPFIQLKRIDAITSILPILFYNKSSSIE
jgi:hypothetical protein